MVNLRRTTLVTLYKVCEEFGIKPGDHFNYNQQTNVITFTNGSQIFLFDLSYAPTDPLYTRLGGLELTGGFVDESNEVDSKAITILLTRIGRRRNNDYAITPKLLETFNPDKNHVYQRFYKPWKESQLPEWRVFIQALVTDNPHATAEYIQQLKRSDKVTRERLLYGNFEYDDDPLTLMGTDAIMDLFTNPVGASGDKYITVDVARFGQDKTVLTVWEGFKVSEVVVRQQQGTEVTAGDVRKLSQKWTIPYSHIIVDEDGIGGGVIDQLSGVRGFTGNATAFDVNGEKQNYQNARSQCYFKLAELVNARGIMIDTQDNDIKNAITEELGQIKAKDIDKDNKRRILPKDEIKERLGRSPDYADALMMRMWFTFNVSERRTTTSTSTITLPVNRNYAQFVNRQSK